VNRLTRNYLGGTIFFVIAGTIWLLAGIYDYTTNRTTTLCGLYILAVVISYGVTIFYYLRWREAEQKENDKQK
jgi:hypothetical protein